MTDDRKPSLTEVKSARHSNEFDSEADPIVFDDVDQPSFDNDDIEAAVSAPTKEDFDQLLKVLITGEVPEDQEFLSLPVYLGVADVARDLFRRQSQSSGTALAPVDERGKAALIATISAFMNDTAQAVDTLDQSAIAAANQFNSQSQTHRFSRQADGSYVLVEWQAPTDRGSSGMSDDLERPAKPMTGGMQNGH